MFDFDKELPEPVQAGPLAANKNFVVNIRLQFIQACEMLLHNTHLATLN